MAKDGRTDGSPVALPADFRISTDRHNLHLRADLDALPQQQQILERALGRTKYIARSVKALAEESGLTEEQVLEYCEASSHIARSPRVDTDGSIYFGHVDRLRKKYEVSEAGEIRHIDLDLGADVFLSFASQDEHVARELADGLKHKGVTAYLSAKDLEPGDPFSDEIRAALRACRFVVLLLTTRSIERPWISFEAGAAWVLDKRIVPALDQVKESDIALEPLRRLHCYTAESTKQRRNLVNTIATMLRSEAAARTRVQ